MSRHRGVLTRLARAVFQGTPNILHANTRRYACDGAADHRVLAQIFQTFASCFFIVSSNPLFRPVTGLRKSLSDDSQSPPGEGVLGRGAQDVHPAV